MSHNILDPSSLTSTLPKLLPSSRKRLESPQDAVAALSHTVLFVLGFRLVAVDDNAPARNILDGVLPEEWSSHGPSHYTFRYKHEQSSLEFIIKVSKLGSRTLVNAIAAEVRIYYNVSYIAPSHVFYQTDKAATLDIATNDFTSPSFFPHELSASDAQSLVHGFISSNRVADFVSQFQLTIVQKLIPGLRKDGYTETESTSQINQQSRLPTDLQPSRPNPIPPPFAPEHRDPWSAIPPRNPLEIGRRDLDPFPRNPFTPPPLFGGFGEGDGMIIGPNHPIFGSRNPANSGIRGPWGGDGFLPPMGAPPGARFDPVGPGLGPHPGGAFPGRRPPGGGNMNDPDNDEFLPPGAVSVVFC